MAVPLPSPCQRGYHGGMDERKPSAGFWIAVALMALLALYPLSFGPVCWRLHGDRQSRLLRAYAPIARVASNGPPIIERPLVWYARIGIPPTDRQNLPTAIDGSSRTSWPSRSDPNQDY